MIGTRQRSISRVSKVSIPYLDITELDEILEKIKLRRFSVPSDGNSFYSAVSHQLSLFGKNLTPVGVRKRCVEYLRTHDKIGDILWWRAIDTGETKDEYLVRNLKDGELADDVIVQTAAETFRYNIVVISIDGTVKFETFSDPLGEIYVAKAAESNYISLEGNARLDEGELPRLFNLRDLVSTTGILKQPKSPHAATGSTKVAIKVEGEENDDDEEGVDPSREERGIPGRNPLAEYHDDFFSQQEETEALLEKPPYDQYICEPPEDDERTTTPLMKFFTKALKFFSYFLFAGIVLGGLLVSKACLMILVNSAKPYIPGGDDDQFDKIDHDVLRIWSFIILLIMMLVPEVLTMVYCLYRVIMKPQKLAKLSTLLWGLMWEALHAIGEAILVLKVLPYLDSTYAILLMPLVAIIPICLQVRAKYLSVKDNSKKQYQQSEQYRRKIKLAMAALALVLQLVGILSLFAGFFSTSYSCGGNVTCTPGSFWFCFLCPNYTYLWALVGIILTSLRYWENFVTSSLQIGTTIKIRARELHNNMDKSRFQISFVYSLVKCLILVGMTFLIFVVVESDTYTSNHILQTAPHSSDRYYTIVSMFSYGGGRPKSRGSILTQLWNVFGVQISCAFAAFFIGRVACMTMIQRESFTLPLVLVTPVISAISAALNVYKQTGGSGLLSFFGLAKQYESIRGIRYYLDWNSVLFEPQSLGTYPTTYSMVSASLLVIIGFIFGAFAILLITTYLWHNPLNRLERMEVLFVKPLYGGALIEQTLLLNRRQYEQEYTQNKLKNDEDDFKKEMAQIERNSSSSRGSQRRKSRRLTRSRPHKFVPQLFLCATMWHETEEEMTQILTSLMRLDRDQGSRRANARDDDDYYNFQVHIMFDDAMQRTNEGKEVTTNKWVHQLCSLIPVAANKVELGKGYDLPDPVIYPTPYGGRLEFVMPHGNLMVIHLKDKEKIRHRKRWSQCMYMYYILGYLQATKRAYKLEDVFLLALDGDVDFQPNAVLLLLDRMKRNPDVGAACGRIHPTGSGPVVWFQKFEYAVGHWLQKTAEHVLGCVLCSPGCFSLFRGAALVDVNVVNQYTTKATEARHYVQWDQGEDRWLCTLLLKQGWRIEYSAASDSYTFAPEEFKEFYNQRRRWGPSTMANIFDILLDAKHAVKNNMYISWGYISYQLGLMISSLLGPATVIMIVQGAYQYVFSWSATVSLIVSLIPVVIFIILCYVTSADTQVGVAALLTIIYALVMMAVVVGVIGSIVTNGFLDPNNIFMMVLVGMYAFTGILHPQELMCLLHGLLYYLCVPSAFIFLMVYSLTNMNNVSWGTRESKTPVSEGESASEQALEQVAGKNKKNRNYQIGPTGSIYDAPSSSDGYYSCGLGNLCQCALCINPQSAQQPAATQSTVRNQPTRRATHYGGNYGAQRRPTMARQSMYKRFSMAKVLQVTGKENEEESDQIVQRLGKRMSVKQLRRISTKMGPDAINTATLRKISSQHRRLSKRSMEQGDPDVAPAVMSETAKELSQQLVEEQQRHEYDDFMDDDYDDDWDEMVDADRMQDEEEEMLYWLMDESMQDGVIEYLDDDERDFWKYLIQHYLHPLDEDKAEKARIKENLKTLRNQVTGAYFLLNALWLILNFALQLTITDIAIIFYINNNIVSVNPVSFAFLLFFLVILVIQFVCMLVHRWSTTLHLLSVTSLKWNDGREGIKNVPKKDLQKAEEMQKFKKKKAANGRILSNIEEPLDREATPGNNFSFKRRNSSGTYENAAFDLENEEEETSLTENSDQVENLYEKIDASKRFDNNPVSHTFGSVSKNYLHTESLPVRKTSTNIDLTIFDEEKSTKEAKREAKQSVFSSPAVEDLIDKTIQAQVHRPASKEKNQTSVRFGELPNDEEEQNTHC